MSTLAVTTIQAPGGTVPTETVRQGSAKAWLNLNGTGTIAIRDSFNVSSVTDNGTGDYTENFTAAMGNANYACAGSLLGALLTNGTRAIVVAGVEVTGPTLKTTSQLRFQAASTTAASFADNAEAMTQIHGDHA